MHRRWRLHPTSGDWRAPPKLASSAGWNLVPPSLSDEQLSACELAGKSHDPSLSLSLRLAPCGKLSIPPERLAAQLSPAQPPSSASAYLTPTPRACKPACVPASRAVRVSNVTYAGVASYTALS